MTTIHTMPTPERAKPGPRPKPPGTTVIKKTVSLQPKTFAFLLKKGKGVLSHGIETLVTEHSSKPK